jgi:hypothetical protein
MSGGDEDQDENTDEAENEDEDMYGDFVANET